MLISRIDDEGYFAATLGCTVPAIHLELKILKVALHQSTHILYFRIFLNVSLLSLHNLYQ